MKKFSLSGKNAKMIYVLLTFVLLVGAFFIYKNNMSQKTAIDDEMVNIDKQLTDLRNMESQRVAKEAETADLTAKCDTMINEFPSKVTAQKAIFQIDELANDSEIVITSIEPTMNQEFYNKQSTATGTTATTTTTATDAAATDTATSTDTTADDGTINYQLLKGYVSTFEINFTATFDQLTKAVDFVVNNPDRMTLGDMAVAFDATTGNLTGSMIVNMYAVEGNGKEYSDPNVSDIKTGVESIFGTFETK